MQIRLRLSEMKLSRKNTNFATCMCVSCTQSPTTLSCLVGKPIRIFIALQCALSNHRPRARCNFVLIATCRLSRST